MRPHVRSVPGTALLLATCVAMAAGCAAAHTAPGLAVGPGPRERAVTDAAAILRAFAVPPGARRYVPRQGQRPAARGRARPGPCGTVQFSAGGKRQPALQITDSFIPQVLK